MSSTPRPFYRSKNSKGDESVLLSERRLHVPSSHSKVIEQHSHWVARLRRHARSCADVAFSRNSFAARSRRVRKNARGGQKCPRRAKMPGFSRARFLFRAFLDATRCLCALIPCLHPASKWRDFGNKRKKLSSRVVCVDTPPGCRRRRRRRRGSSQSADGSRLEPGTHRRVMTRRTVRLESGAQGFESKAKTTIPTFIFRAWWIWCSFGVYFKTWFVDSNSCYRKSN